MCAKNQAENVRMKISSTREPLTKYRNLYSKLRRIGDFSNGHLNGLHKSHKVLHETSQYMISIIRFFVSMSYMHKSGDHLFVDFENLKFEQGQGLASSDLVNLFINFPVQESIELILNKTYRRETLSSPSFPKLIMRELL